MLFNCIRRHHITGVVLMFFMFMTAIMDGPVRAVNPEKKNDEDCPPVIVPAAPCAAVIMLRQTLEELQKKLAQATSVSEMQSIQRRIHCTQLALTTYERQCAMEGENPPPGKPLPMPTPDPSSGCTPIMLPGAPCAAVAVLRNTLEELEKRLATAQTPDEIQFIQHQIRCVKTDYGRYEEKCARDEQVGQPGKPLPGPVPADPDLTVCPETEFGIWMQQDPCGLLFRLNRDIEELQRQLAQFPPREVPVTGVTGLKRAMIERKLQCHTQWMEKVRQAVSVFDPTICGTQSGENSMERFQGQRPSGPPLHERISPSGNPSHSQMCAELNRRLQEIMGRINQGQPVPGTVMLQLREIESRIRQFCNGEPPNMAPPERGHPGPALGPVYRRGKP